MKGTPSVDQAIETIEFNNIHFFFMTFEDLCCTHFCHLFSNKVLSSLSISAEQKVLVTHKISI